MIVYIDSNIFVNAKRRKEKTTHKISKEFMDYVIKLNRKEDKIDFFTSRYTGVELASAMIRQTQNKYRAKSILYELGKEWEDKIGLIPENPKKTIKWEDFLKRLQEIVIEYKVPASDSIHAMALLELSPNYFVTWNKKHFAPLIKKMKNTIMVDPKEFMSELKKVRIKNKKMKEEELYKEVFRRLFERKKFSIDKEIRNYLAHFYNK